MKTSLVKKEHGRPKVEYSIFRLWWQITVYIYFNYFFIQFSELDRQNNGISYFAEDTSITVEIPLDILPKAKNYSLKLNCSNDFDLTSETCHLDGNCTCNELFPGELYNLYLLININGFKPTVTQISSTYTSNFEVSIRFC